MLLPLRFYWMLLWRRLPVMGAAVVLCSAAALYAAIILPPVYSATARFQVEAPQIPDEMVSGLLATDASEELQLIEEQLMTRANLLDIARKHNVFEPMDEMTPTDIVNAMRESTEINRSGRFDQATLMSISFNASDGQVAANVVDDFTTIVLEENATSRRERAENTLTFFEQETERLAGEIDAQSNRIIDFKNAHLDALPDDLSYRQNRQTGLQERLNRLEQERAAVINQRSDMLALFEATGRMATTEEALTPDQRRLQELERELDSALAIFSDTNPRVAVLRNQIAQLEARLADTVVPGSTSGSTSGGGTVSTVSDDGEPLTGNAVIDVALAEMDQRISQIDLEITNVTEEIGELNRAIAATATNAIALERLERDLGSIRARYNATLENLNQARMAERVEVKAQGQRVTLIEGAIPADEPSGPPRRRIAAAGVAAGLMAAAGIFVILEFLNQKLRHPAEMQSRFQIIPMGVIPYVETRGERLRRSLLLIFGFLGIIALVLAALYVIDTEVMPLEVLTNRILRQFGLT